jgi:death-on-curing protein
MTHDFPTPQEVIAIHDTLIAEFGGSPGIRDEASLISAIMRPQLGYYKTLIQEATALMESLANNHPFVDGNKRVAFFAADTFLRMNGYFIDCDNDEAYAFFIDLFESHRFRFEKLEEWLEGKVRTLPADN